MAMAQSANEAGTTHIFPSFYAVGRLLGIGPSCRVLGTRSKIRFLEHPSLINMPL